MSTLEAERQRLLLQAVLAGAEAGEGSTPSPWRGLPGVPGGAERGLRAYRLNAAALAERALGAVFERLRERLGEADFAAMAWAFWRWQPPPRGDLGEWGGALTGFLAGQPGMEAELPELAALEWALHQAERAADASLDAASLQRLGDCDAAALRLRFRPGLQLLDQPSQGQVLLVWREGWRARSEALPAADAALLAQLLAGADLQTALDACLGAHPEFDFAAWLQAALLRQQLWRVETLEES